MATHQSFTDLEARIVAAEKLAEKVRSSRGETFVKVLT